MKRFAAIIAIAASALLTNISEIQAQGPAIEWRFGMNVTLVQNGNQRGLSITSVTPGSPAQRAGLQRGDVILSSNNVRFNHAMNDYQGVALLQQSVTRGGGGGGVPTVAMSTNSMYPNQHPAAVLLVVKPCGTTVQRKCFPQYVGIPTGIPEGVPTF